MHRTSLSPIRWVSLAVVGVSAIALALLLLGSVSPVEASVLAAPIAQANPPDNAQCLACHSQPNMTATLQSGETLPVTIDPTTFGGSVHGMANISCTSCHPDITGYPHPANPDAQDRRDYSLMFKDTCQGCHNDQYQKTLDSMHYEAFLAGNKNAPICSDCHDPHAQAPITGSEGKIPQQEKLNISQTCARCHNTIYEEYTNSVHGTALKNGNPDVPTCIDCHGVHNIPDPTSAEFRLSSVNVCAKCHTDESIMSKYGLSTKVLDTYIDDFHGKTVELFEQTEPGQAPNTPVCFDCHGVHNIVSVNDPQEGIAAKENLLATCQKCHPDASANFPTAWLGHYVPDRQKFPLVYWVTVFYRIFVPGVLGIMAVFVATDIYRRTVVDRRRRNTPQDTAQASGTNKETKE